MTGRRFIRRVAGGDFPSGTRILFQQTAPPSGWVKETTAAYNDTCPRIVTGSVGNGGSVDFSTAFSLTATDAFALLETHIPAHDHGAAGSHTHTVPIDTNVGTTGAGRAQGVSTFSANINTGGGGSHSHASYGGGTGHAHDIDLQLKYYDVIIAAKA